MLSPVVVDTGVTSLSDGAVVSVPVALTTTLALEAPFGDCDCRMEISAAHSGVGGDRAVPSGPREVGGGERLLRSNPRK